MDNKIYHREDIIPLVLECYEILKTKTDFKFTDGFIGGGSIANYVWHRITGNPWVLNDIDYYISNDSDIFDIFDNFNVVVDDDYEMPSIVTSVSNDDIVNIIKLYKDSYSINYISNFDMTCCMVGIDCNTLQPYIDDRFIDFINTKINRLNLDTRRLCINRFLKKKYELKCEIYDLDLIYLFHNKIKIIDIKFKFEYFNDIKNDIIITKSFEYIIINHKKYKFISNKYLSSFLKEILYENKPLHQKFIDMNIGRYGKYKYKEALNILINNDFIYEMMSIENRISDYMYDYYLESL